MQCYTTTAQPRIGASAACCLHLCGNPTMSTMQHKSDNAFVVLSDRGKSSAAGSTCLLLLLLLFPVLLCRTKIARFSLSLFVMPLSPLCPLPSTRSTFHLLQVAFLCPQFALVALSTSFALLLFPHCEQQQGEAE